MRIVKTNDIGARVRRGMDWKWSNQDREDKNERVVRGATGLGTIVGDPSNMSKNWVSVHWDSGATSYQYRIGKDGKYDLCYAESEIDLMKVLEL